MPEDPLGTVVLRRESGQLKIPHEDEQRGAP